MVTKETQAASVLKLLRSKNPDGSYRWITTNQLLATCWRFSAKIFELRHQGYEIEKRLTRDGWQYRYSGNLDRELEYAD